MVTSSHPWFAVACFATLLGSCYPLSTLQEPQTLAPGKVRVTAQVRVGGASHEPIASLVPDFQLRVGVLERLEVQGGVTLAGGRLALKALVVDWPALMVAVVPTYQVGRVMEDADEYLDEEFYPDYLVQTAIVPVIVGIPVGAHADVLLGADVHAGRRKGEQYGVDESGPVLGLGAHLGMALHTPRGHASIVPQCGMLASLLGEPRRIVPSYDGAEPVRLDDLRRGNVRWECALGISFGSRYAARTR